MPWRSSRKARVATPAASPFTIGVVATAQRRPRSPERQRGGGDRRRRRNVDPREPSDVQRRGLWRHRGPRPAGLRRGGGAEGTGLDRRRRSLLEKPQRLVLLGGRL